MCAPPSELWVRAPFFLATKHVVLPLRIFYPSDRERFRNAPTIDANRKESTGVRTATRWPSPYPTRTPPRTRTDPACGTIRTSDPRHVARPKDRASRRSTTKTARTLRSIRRRTWTRPRVIEPWFPKRNRTMGYDTRSIRSTYREPSGATKDDRTDRHETGAPNRI